MLAVNQGFAFLLFFPLFAVGAVIAFYLATGFIRAVRDMFDE